MKLDLHERDYRKIANRMGLCLSLFVLMFSGTGMLVSWVSGYLFYLFEYEVYYTVQSTLSIVAYLASFMLPAVILRAMLKKDALACPMQLEYRFPRRALLLIPAGVGITMTLAYVNSILLEGLGLTDVYNSLIGESTTIYEPYQIVLLYISTALVPAVCEEFLFRATVLASLRPFGQGVALVSSAVLFGLMHQNPYQLLYATAAGLILGYAYIKTESIWCPMLIHLINNAYSVTSQVLYANAGERVSDIIVPIADVLIIVAGFACFALFLVIDARRQRCKYDGGSFGVLLEADDSYEQRSISAKSKLRSFFAPWMIVFIVLVFLSIAMTLAVLILIDIGALII